MKLLLLLIGAFTLGAVLAPGPIQPAEEPPAKEIDPDRIASRNWETARKFVESSLKAPSTATWSRFRDDRSAAIALGYDVWETSGEVDAQNSFGAYLRYPWRMVLHGEKSEYYYIQIGEQITGNLERVRDLASDGLQIRAIPDMSWR